MLNQDFNQKVVMDPAHLRSIDSPCDGVKRILLERSEDSEFAISTTIVDFDAGSYFEEHVHDLGEELFVLEGVFSDESGDYPGNVYQKPSNSKHKPFSKSGCRLFVKLRQFNEDDNKKIIINTNYSPWLPGIVEGLQVLPLHNFECENTALVKWDPNTKFNPHNHFGGEEILVISGTFYDEYGSYPKYSWIRSPHMSQHTPYTLDDGALIFVKTGHLLNKR